MATLTKIDIVTMLKNNDKAVGRALVVLTARQTTDEKIQETTKYANGRGFRPCHARMGTSMGEFYKNRGFLSPKQVAYWRRPMKDGKMRIEIYAGQLLEVAQEKAAQKMIHEPSPKPLVEVPAERNFSTKDEAWDWMENAVNDGCVDNYRFAYLDSPEEMEKYEEQERQGCCGRFDSYVMINGRKATIGCNYGH